MEAKTNTTPRWHVLLGAALVVLGIGVCWKASTKMGYDLGPLYIMSIGLVQGKNVFSLDVQQGLYAQYLHSGVREMGYPPSTAFVTAPLTIVPYPAARLLWFGSLVASVMGGVYALLRAFAPPLRRSQYLLACGLALLSAGTRWCLTPLQGAPLILLLLGLFALAFKAQNTRALFVLAFLAVSFKPTFALPFLILPLVQRRFTLVVSVLVSAAIVNMLGFWRMGGMQAMQDYRICLANFELSPVNAADPRLVDALYRCDWVRLGVGLTHNASLGHQFAIVLTLLTLLYLGWVGWRLGQNRYSYSVASAFLAPSVCLTLLGVYHQHYDMLLLIAPFILYLYAPGAEQKRMDIRLFLSLVFLFVGFYPLAQAHHFLLQVFGIKGVVTARILVPLLLTLLLAASLSALNRETKRKESAYPQDDLPPIINPSVEELAVVETRPASVINFQ